jgi:hypothetical protein
MANDMLQGMSRLFARHLLRCSQCGTVLRECDEFCPQCLSERASSKSFYFIGKIGRLLRPVARGALFVGACLAIAGVWLWTDNMRINQENELGQIKANNEQAARERQQAISRENQRIHEPFESWINTPRKR